MTRTKMKPSISSRASVRSLIVACMPAAALAVIANSPALGAVFGESANQGLTVADKTAANPKAPSTNGIGNTTNNNFQVPITTQGVRG